MPKLSCHLSLVLLMASVLFASIACSKSQRSPEEIREKTANATAELKSGAKAAAEGIREGWSRDKVLDLNSAPQTKLVTLPGVSTGKAEQIVRNRPYQATDDLVKKGILNETAYRKIADRIAVK